MPGHGLSLLCFLLFVPLLVKKKHAFSMLFWLEMKQKGRNSDKNVKETRTCCLFLIHISLQCIFLMNIPNKYQIYTQI